MGGALFRYVPVTVSRRYTFCDFDNLLCTTGLCLCMTAEGSLGNELRLHHTKPCYPVLQTKSGSQHHLPSAITCSEHTVTRAAQPTAIHAYTPTHTSTHIYIHKVDRMDCEKRVGGRISSMIIIRVWLSGIIALRLVVRLLIWLLV
jgi:hypothetical protein